LLLLVSPCYVPAVRSILKLWLPGSESAIASAKDAILNMASSSGRPPRRHD